VSLIAVLSLIAPVFLIVVLGCLLRSNGIPNFEFWNLNDKPVYSVLMPVLLFHKASTSEIFL
jgi:predicted permease